MMFSHYENYSVKVHIFWEGHKILGNLHQLFDWYYTGQIIGGDFAKFCGLLRKYELYLLFTEFTKPIALFSLFALIFSTVNNVFCTLPSKNLKNTLNKHKKENKLLFTSFHHSTSSPVWADLSCNVICLNSSVCCLSKLGSKRVLLSWNSGFCNKWSRPSSTIPELYGPEIKLKKIDWYGKWIQKDF